MAKLNLQEEADNSVKDLMEQFNRFEKKQQKTLDQVRDAFKKPESKAKVVVAPVSAQTPVSTPVPVVSAPVAESANVTKA